MLKTKDRSHWITHEQLNTPLCDIFPGTKTNGTAALFIQTACFLLGEQPRNVNELSYEELNEWMDELSERLDQLNETPAPSAFKC